MRMFFGDFQLNQGVFLNICDFWYNPDLFFSYLTYFFLYLSVPSTLNTVINWQSITAQRLFPLLQNIMHQFSRNSRIEHFYYAYHKINEMSKRDMIISTNTVPSNSSSYTFETFCMTCLWHISGIRKWIL